MELPPRVVDESDSAAEAGPQGPVEVAAAAETFAKAATPLMEPDEVAATLAVLAAAGAAQGAAPADGLEEGSSAELEEAAAGPESWGSGEAGVDSKAELCGLRFEALLSEVFLFESLTWLEAAVFFLFAIQEDPGNTEAWSELARHRWENFQTSKHSLNKHAGDLLRLDQAVRGLTGDSGAQPQPAEANKAGAAASEATPQRRQQSSAVLLEKDPQLKHLLDPQVAHGERPTQPSREEEEVEDRGAEGLAHA